MNFTVLAPWVDPKFVPVRVTEVPTAPELGDAVVMLGAATTVNAFPALDDPLTVTTTLPLVVPVGTTATIDVALQVEIVVAAVPLNFTVLDPRVVPKPVPVIVMEAPTAPEVGDRLVMLGAAVASVATERRKHKVQANKTLRIKGLIRTVLRIFVFAINSNQKA